MFGYSGNCTRSEHYMLQILHNVLTITKEFKICSLYIFDNSIVIDNASLSSQYFYNKTKLWHFRLWDVGERGFVKLAKKGLLGSEKLNKLEFCEHYIIGKRHRVESKSNMSNFKTSFEYVHSDLWSV